MRDHLQYAVLGNGRWAQVMYHILAQYSRVTIVGQTRRAADENEGDYQRRMAAVLASTGADAAWLCVPPSPNTRLLIDAAIGNGMHAVVEKPWLWGRPVTQELAAKAEARGVLIGVHYEYCLLDKVESWRSERNGGTGHEFAGRFTTSRQNRLGIPAILNLGSHLFAIRDYAVPQAEIVSIECAYDGIDERTVHVTAQGGTVDEIDFSANREPIIERYIARFEAGAHGAPFAFTLDFASRVNETLNAFHPEEAAP
jgi:predicted dehydrogenase